MRKVGLALIVAILLPSCTGFPWPSPVEPPGRLVPTATTTPAPTPDATATPLPTMPATPRAPFDDFEEHEAALLSDFAADVEVLDGATAYQIEASVDYERGSAQAEIDGRARILYTNPGPDSVSQIPLVLWPNDDQYRGRAVAGPALIDDVLTAGEPELAGLAQRFDLLDSLAPGDSVDMTVPFHVWAEGPIGGETPHRFGISEGVLFAPTFYPLVPRRIDGKWEVEEAPRGGDTTTSLVAAYWVDLEVPAELDLVATGVEVGRQGREEGRVSVRYVSGPVRDFAFALGDLEQHTRQRSGVDLHLWVLSDHEGDTETVLDSAGDQLALLSEVVGPYPYTELDIVDVPGAFGGIEYPGLVTIGTLGGPWIVEPVVHEVAHQWFYGLIGDDQVDDPWLDEAFATYATALYYEQAVNPGRATGYLSDFRQVVRNHPGGERPIGLAVGAYEGRDYSILVYLKGALFYQELRQEMGDEYFFDFLKRVYERYRYDVIEPEQFHEVAEDACGCQLDELFDLWVYEGGPLTVP